MRQPIICFISHVLGMMVVITGLGAQNDINWYFGDSCHVRFENIGGELTPVIQTATDRPNTQVGGMVSVSDEQGRLLFYSDGVEVRDQNMNVVRDDLLGNNISTTSAIAIRKPCTSNEYYLFTTTPNGTPDVVNYSVVTMNGLDVLSVSDPILLTTGVHSKTALVPHPTESGFWAIHPLYNPIPASTSSFNISYFDCNGLQTSVVETTDTPIGIDQGGGYLKASPNGRFLVNPIQSGSQVTLYEFDPLTGEIEYCRNIIPGGVTRPYGVEFSDSSCDVFFSVSGATFEDTSSARIVHHRIPENITTQRFLDPDAPQGFIWEAAALQKGPDGYIYVALPFTNKLGRLDPDAADPLSTLDLDFLSFGPGLGKVWYGLPQPLPPPLTEGGCLPPVKDETCFGNRIELVADSTENCCFAVFLENPAANEATAFTEVIINSSGIGGYSIFPPPLDWDILAVNDTTFSIRHSSGSIPTTSPLGLFDLCYFVSQNSPPAPTYVSWLSVQDTLCSDTLLVDCSECFSLAEGYLYCEGDAFSYEYSFTNDSPYEVTAVEILPAEGSADLILNAGIIDLEGPLPAGGQYAGFIKVDFVDQDDDGTVCFDQVLRRIIPSEQIDINCCFKTICVELEAEKSYPLISLPDSIDAACDSSIVIVANEVAGVADSMLLYEWTARTGQILSGTQGMEVLVHSPGEYQLVVYNLESGCTDTASVVVSGERLPLAALGNDLRTCDLPLAVTGNLPAGTFGSWTVLGDTSAAWSYQDEVFRLTDFGDTIILVWTLSSQSCLAYSADTLLITPDVNLSAMNDSLVFATDPISVSVDLLANDLVPDGYGIRIIREPGFGDFALTDDGILTFTPPSCENDSTVLVYELCSVDCGVVCDTAVVSILPDPIEPYNLITPNGDNLNDTFVFEDLFCPDAENNEIIIFNRWGDIIYTASPYDNDWGGVNQKGQPVPEGTYYYVFQIFDWPKKVTGDITIIR